MSDGRDRQRVEEVSRETDEQGREVIREVIYEEPPPQQQQQVEVTVRPWTVFDWIPGLATLRRQDREFRALGWKKMLIGAGYFLAFSFSWFVLYMILFVLFGGSGGLFLFTLGGWLIGGFAIRTWYLRRERKRRDEQQRQPRRRERVVYREPPK